MSNQQAQDFYDDRRKRGMTAETIGRELESNGWSKADATVFIEMQIKREDQLVSLPNTQSVITSTEQLQYVAQTLGQYEKNIQHLASYCISAAYALIVIGGLLEMSTLVFMGVILVMFIFPGVLAISYKKRDTAANILLSNSLKAFNINFENQKFRIFAYSFPAFVTMFFTVFARDLIEDEWNAIYIGVTLYLFNLFLPLIFLRYREKVIRTLEERIKQQIK